MKIPKIDLRRFTRGGAAEKKRIARAVDRACRGTGFLLITGHGVPERLARDAERAARAFFTLDAVEKSKCSPPKTMRGYMGLGSETLSYGLGRKSPPDMSESFVVGPPGYPGNVWPRRPARLRRALTDYYRAMEALSAELMRLFAAALEVDESVLLAGAGRPISRLRARHYPAQSRAPREGQLRAGAHTDYGVLTILRPDAAVGGLEIKGAARRWIKVPRAQDAFIVNIGDLMARWTNGRWASTVHRVANESLERPRLSLAYFHYPKEDAVVAKLPGSRGRAKYPPVTAGLYLREKLRATVRG